MAARFIATNDLEMTGIAFRSLLLFLTALALTGCLSKRLSDPNDPASGPITPRALQSDLLGVTNLLATRWGKKEITEEQFKSMTVEGANILVERAHIQTIEDSEAWRYAEVLRAAQQWTQAEPVLRQAVKWAKSAKSNDRWVNDSLRLSQTLAHEGKVVEAISTARSVFDVPPVDAAPILVAVRLEIAPAAANQKHDAEVAQLLLEAAAKQVTVDPKTPEGKIFLAAHPVHQQKAIGEAMLLFDHAGEHDRGEAAKLKLFPS